MLMHPWMVGLEVKRGQPYALIMDATRCEIAHVIWDSDQTEGKQNLECLSMLCAHACAPFSCMTTVGVLVLAGDCLKESGG